MDALITRWITAIGAQRTARWYITAADRDRPGHLIQLVEPPVWPTGHGTTHL